MISLGMRMKERKKKKQLPTYLELINYNYYLHYITTTITTTACIFLYISKYYVVQPCAIQN